VSRERFIRGKLGDGNHGEHYAHAKPQETADFEKGLIEQLEASKAVWRDRNKLPPEMVEWHRKNLEYWGIIGSEGDRDRWGK
jgi:hypothetical protein